MTQAQAFLDMAADIDRNDETKFSGAFVAVGPDGAIVSGLLIDQAKNPAAFWSMVQAKVEIAAQEAKGSAQMPGQFGGRR